MGPSSLFAEEGGLPRPPSKSASASSGSPARVTERRGTQPSAKRPCWRPTHPFPSGMGRSHRQSLGSIHTQGWPYATVEARATCFLGDSAHTSAKVAREGGSTSSRSPSFTGQVGYRGSAVRSRKSGVLLHLLSGDQERRRFQTDFESQRSKPADRGPLVQDGDTAFSDLICPEGRMAHVHRPQRCLPAYSDAPPVQEIPSVLFRRGLLPVSGSTLRHFDCPQGVHQTHADSSTGSQVTGHVLSPIPGRLVDKGAVPSDEQGDHTVGAGHPHPSRLDYQPQEIRFESGSKPDILRCEIRHGARNCLPGSRPYHQGPRDDIFVHRSPTSTGSELAPIARAYGGNRGCGMASSVENETNAASFGKSVVTLGGLGEDTHNSPVAVLPPSVVDRCRASLQGAPPGDADPDAHGSDRRIPHRVGWRLGQHVGIRTLVRGRGSAAYQCLGTESSQAGFREILGDGSEPSGSSRIRQSHGDDLYPEARRHGVTLASLGGMAVSTVVRPVQYIGSSNIPPRVRERPSGCAIETNPGTARVDARSEDIRDHFPIVRIVPGGSVCVWGDESDTSVLLSDTGPEGTDFRCLQARLDGQGTVGIPPFTSDLSSPFETVRPAGSASCAPCTSLAVSELVSGDTQVSGSASCSITFKTGHSIPERSAPPESSDSMGGLAAVRDRLSSSGIPANVADTILASRRDSTNVQYEDRWACYVRWCGDRGIPDPFSADLVQILEFLQSRLEAGLAASTIRGYSTAISTFHIPINGVLLGQHPLVQRFLAGVDRIRPALRRFSPPWDLSIVLDWLSGPTFENLSSLPLRLLSWKAAFLVAVTSGRRVGDIHAMSASPELTVFHKDRVSIRLPDSYRPKIDNAFHVTAPINLPTLTRPSSSGTSATCAHTLDVRRTLKVYIKRTKELRKDSQLFCCYGGGKAGLPASKQTISRWLVSCICSAYVCKGKLPPEGLKAHSVRAVATSKAFGAALPIEEICSAAIWSRPSTFIKHYQLDKHSRERARFGQSVLSSGRSHNALTE